MVKQAAEADLLRMKYGAGIIVTGLIVLLVVFLVAVHRYGQAADVATAVGALTTVVGTLIGAYFGAHVGAAGRERAQATAVRLAAFMRPEDARAALCVQDEPAHGRAA